MGMKAFFEKKGVKLSWKVYFVDAMGAMAYGLFASLLVGTIIGTIGNWVKWAPLSEIASIAKNNYVVGGVIAISIAVLLKAPPLVMYSAATVGAISYSLGYGTYSAGPAGVFIAAIIAIEIGKLISKETKVDILVTPIVTIGVGYAVARLVCPGIAIAMNYLGNFINSMTEANPFIMGIIISAVVGIVLTLPISSAAICAMIGISGIAGGAAMAGCCAHMVGFAVMSFRENRWNGLIAQGLGTSMLQMGNLVRRPVLWVPVVLVSMITGPISTMVFKLKCEGVSAGMGTCGLVGPLGSISVTENKDLFYWIGLLLVCVVLPAVLAWLFGAVARKMGVIREGDLKLDL